jgi:hypothetical protein
MLTGVLAAAAIGIGLWLGFVAPPSRRSLAALGGGTAVFFLAALAVHGWPDLFAGHLALVAYGLALAIPVTASRFAATKWTSPEDL